jgi:hypothetical protein
MKLKLKTLERLQWACVVAIAAVIVVNAPYKVRFAVVAISAVVMIMHYRKSRELR